CRPPPSPGRLYPRTVREARALHVARRASLRTRKALRAPRSSMHRFEGLLSSSQERRSRGQLPWANLRPSARAASLPAPDCPPSVEPLVSHHTAPNIEGSRPEDSRPGLARAGLLLLRPSARTEAWRA